MIGVTTAQTEKADKRRANSRLRVRLRSTAAQAGPDFTTDLLWPVPREVSEPWDMAKDGMLLFDPVRWARFLRK